MEGDYLLMILPLPRTGPRWPWSRDLTINSWRIGWPAENSCVQRGPIYIRIDEEVHIFYNSTLQHYNTLLCWQESCCFNTRGIAGTCSGGGGDHLTTGPSSPTLSPREKAHDCHVSCQSLALLPRHPVVRWQIIYFKSLVFLTASSTF